MQNRLLCFTHNPPHKVYIKENLKELIKAIQIYCKSFYSFTLIGKYNAKVTETSMASFDEKYELKSFKINLLATKNYQIYHVEIYFSQIMPTVLKKYLSWN